jgi:Tfp pilus assembly protein PilV
LRLCTSSGVGLLEVLVSFALVAGVGLAVLTWYQQNLLASGRLRDFYERQLAREHALSVVQSINPMQQAAGEAQWRGWRFSWKAEALTDEVAQAGYPSGVGGHVLRLYEVQIQGFRDGAITFDFEEKTQSVGHRHVGGSAPSPLLR